MANLTTSAGEKHQQQLSNPVRTRLGRVFDLVGPVLVLLAWVQPVLLIPMLTDHSTVVFGAIVGEFAVMFLWIARIYRRQERRIEARLKSRAGLN